MKNMKNKSISDMIIKQCSHIDKCCISNLSLKNIPSISIDENEFWYMREAKDLSIIERKLKKLD